MAEENEEETTATATTTTTTVVVESVTLLKKESSSSRLSSSILLLPKELLMDVLCWIKPEDLLLNVSIVSKQFSGLLLHKKSFWIKYYSNLLVPVSKKEDREILGCNCNNNLDFDLDLNLNTNQWQRSCLFVTAKNEESRRRQQTLLDDGFLNNGSNGFIKNYCSIPQKYLKLGSVLVSRDTAQENAVVPPKKELLYCVASSTDHDNESIENVLLERETEEHYIESTWDELPPDESNLHSALSQSSPASMYRRLLGLRIEDILMHGVPTMMSRWWSSKPTERNDTKETLLFCTKYPLAMISEVVIKPLRDPYNNTKVYTWNNTIIKAYRFDIKNNNNSDDDDDNTNNNRGRFTIKQGFPCSIQRTTNDDNDEGISSSSINNNIGWLHRLSNIDGKSIIEDVLDGQNPVYESSLLPGPNGNNNEWKRYNVPDWTVANAITITLIGKNCRQFDGNDENNNNNGLLMAAAAADADAELNNNNNNDNNDEEHRNRRRQPQQQQQLVVLPDQQSGYFACVESVLVRGIPL